MLRILFLCHGNTCRSAMAEYIAKHMCKNRKTEYRFSSAGVSAEEHGNDMYPPAKYTLEKHKIPYTRHFAHRITKKDYDENDLILCMDCSNLSYLNYLMEDRDHKVRMLLDRDVEDPWYTDDYETAYNAIVEGIEKMLEETDGNQ